MDIKKALEELDTMEDSHWTADGSPAIDAVTKILGKKVTRAEITDTAPKFTRQNTDLSEPKDSEPEETPPEEIQPEIDEEPDLTVLKKFAEMDPMDQNEFAEKVLKKINAKLLPEVELMLAEQMQTIEQKEREVEEMKRRVKLCRALTQTWIKALIPDMSNQEAIQAYIRSSAERRAQATAEIRQVLGGLKPSDIAKLDPRAAIDKAFARKTARGGQRPVR